jgi:hypothetical protein
MSVASESSNYTPNAKRPASGGTETPAGRGFVVHHYFAGLVVSVRDRHVHTELFHQLLFHRPRIGVFSRAPRLRDPCPLALELSARTPGRRWLTALENWINPVLLPAAFPAWVQ